VSLGERTAALQAVLEAYPGAGAFPVPVPRGRPSPAVMYKVKLKIFAILMIRGAEAVILKSDPHLGEILREQYCGVTDHRTHLSRNWMRVALDSDVPPEEVERLVASSYELVCAGLTRKQRAELAALSGEGPARTKSN
jgi:predicted DNA-binding protein (MmcQ/YjbR family)